MDQRYGVHVAGAAVSRLMGLEDWPEESSAPPILRGLVTLLWK